MKESKLELEGIDVIELGKYITVTATKEEVKKDKLEEVLPIMVRKRSMRQIAGKKSMSGFQQPARLPTTRELRSMLALAFKKATLATLSRHVYTFDGKTFIQGKGGSIGSELTGELARLYMLLWDRKYLDRLKSLGIKVILYKRYVDDVIIITERVKETYTFNGKSMVRKAEHVQEGRMGSNSDYTENTHTLETLAAIANTLDKDIVMEPDVGENHGDNKIPVLDLVMWMEG